MYWMRLGRHEPGRERRAGYHRDGLTAARALEKASFDLIYRTTFTPSTVRVTYRRPNLSRNIIMYPNVD